MRVKLVLPPFPEFFFFQPQKIKKILLLT
jgi:hypothetical protein